MAGQVSYHLLAQAGITRAPWPITTLVSCLPVLVLTMGTALAHMLRADAAADRPDAGTSGPAASLSPAWSREDQDGPRPGWTTDQGTRAVSGPPLGTRTAPRQGQGAASGSKAPSQAEISQARLIAGRLTAAGKPVSRRALRSGGIRGSNEALNALARMINAELADTASLPNGYCS